jgi:hypothetical protein
VGGRRDAGDGGGSGVMVVQAMACGGHRCRVGQWISVDGDSDVHYRVRVWRVTEDR